MRTLLFGVSFGQEAKSPTVAHLPPYVLSARSTPEEFTDDVLKGIDAASISHRAPSELN
jgi:hypothetical protein